MTQQAPLVLFDGVCNLCNSAVQWIIRRDQRAKYRFASLQSAAGRAAVVAAGVQPDSLPDSMVLIDKAGLHLRSTAALRILKGLGLPYSLGAGMLLIPRVLRDAVYKQVARRRYAWFGRRDACMMPKPEWKTRFLDADEAPPPPS